MISFLKGYKKRRISFYNTQFQPVELLYRSLDDVKREVSRKDAQTTYQELEKERQQKLETCRRIRNELLMQGYPYCRPSSSLRNHHGNKSSSCPTPLAEIRTNPKVGSQDNFKSREQDFLVSSPLSPFPNTRKSGAQTPNLSEGNAKHIGVCHSSAGANDVIKRPLVVKSEVIPIGVTGAEASFKCSQQAPVLDLCPLLSLKKSDANSSIFDERKIKSAEQVSKPSPRRSGRHKRSQSLPLRPDTPKGTISDLKSDKTTSRTGSSVGNQGRKSSLEMLDLGKNLSTRNLGSPGSFEMLSIDKKKEHHVSFEDINNNHSKAPVTSIMRQLSSRRKKPLDRRKLLECKKVFDQIRAQYKDPEYCLLKYRQIIDNSIERELREQEVRKVQRRMEEGYEMWQDKVLMLQWLDSERAEEQVSRNLSTKIEKIKQQQKNKEIVHAINLNKVKEDDDIRAEVLRRELEKKERKIQILQEEKERVIFESKSRALAVSELKEQIRNIMTPETFDQKVSKCGREKKVIQVLHPPTRCPAIMQQSHISLG